LELVALSPLVMLLLLSFLASSGHHHGLMALLRACISWRGVVFLEGISIDLNGRTMAFWAATPLCVCLFIECL
jgi:hypothetical protein